MNVPAGDIAALYQAEVRRLRAFVRRIVGNHGADVELTGVELEHVADPRPTPETIVMHRRELRRLLEAIAALPERRRQAFVLKRIEGLAYDEIAERMGISRNTVISQVVAAMAQLDAMLEPV